jgi:hypothetical protein
MAMFADDTAVMGLGGTVQNSGRTLQSAVKNRYLDKKMATKAQRCKILGFHGGDNEEWRLLG